MKLQWIVFILMSLLVCGLAIWVSLFFWVHQLMGVMTGVFIIAFVLCAVVVSVSLWHKLLPISYLQTLPFGWVILAKGGFWGVSLVAVLGFFVMPARNDRIWYPEVAKQVDFKQQGNIITVYNVRNFAWHGLTDYTPNWQTRQYDLNKLVSMDLILSIWDNENIAHTMVSFGFLDGERLVFSVEIRKEVGESFSAIGGFFRLYELSLIAADEKDVIYTRSNVRKETVYLYPIQYEKEKMQRLFLTYLKTGQELQNTPQWYNTLFSNCTTVIYDMVKAIDDVSMDYRILVSGRLPDYLYELGVLDNQDTLVRLKQKAHINPKVAQYKTSDEISSAQYSWAIRQNLSD